VSLSMIHHFKMIDTLQLEIVFNRFYNEYYSCTSRTHINREAPIHRLSRQLTKIKVDTKRTQNDFNELKFYKKLSEQLCSMYVKMHTAHNPRLDITRDASRFKLLRILSHRACFNKDDTPKKIHTDLESAQIAAIEHERKLNVSASYYPCCFCGGYHLGSKQV